MERKLAVILSADVAGYCSLMEADEAGTFERLRMRRKELFEPEIDKHHGRIFKLVGDGLLAEFGSVVDAVECAVTIQRGMMERNANVPEEKRIEVRIGINLGEVIVESDDRYGEGVNVAARLQQLADPGGICVSGKVSKEVEKKLAFGFEPMGEQQMKNIAEPIACFRVNLQLANPAQAEPSTQDRLPDRKAATGAKMDLAMPGKPSIAVLPFQNMSGDPEQDYFADGIVEEIITALSRTRWLFVIARNSSFTYKGRAVDVKQVGRELGVRYILEGSVRKSGNRLRITGQLIDSSSGAHLWADRFDGGLEDVFELQDQVAANVVGVIAPKVEAAEIARATQKPTENLHAYDHYLRGLANLHKFTRAGNDAALEHFYRAIELDPNYASAYGLAARTYVQRNAGGWIVDRAKESTESERLARRAAALGQDDAVALSNAAFALSDIPGALADADAFVERALKLNPNLASAWLYSGWVKASRGDANTALEHLARARQLSPNDPQDFSLMTAMAFAHFVAGRYSEGLAHAEAAERTFPNYLLAMLAGAVCAALAGRDEVANETMGRVLQITPKLSVSLVRPILIMRPEDFARWKDGLLKAGLPE